MKVNLFIPCFIDQFFPDVALATVKLLEYSGCEIIYNKNQTCCGQPAFNSGYFNEAKELARHFLQVFDNDYPIVAPSASCTGFIRRNYRKLDNSTEYLDKVFKLETRIFELTDFLVNQLKVTDFGARFEATVTYHDACSALREYGIKQEPRILLSKVKGLKLVEMSEAETCCGFGGTFSVKYSPISVAMVEQKTESALETKADYIVSTESSCLMNIGGYIERNNLNIKTKHIAEILASF